MSKPVTHIIHKLNLEIAVPGERLARHIYAQAGTWIQQYVLPKLEEILKRYGAVEQHIRLDTLDIDLDSAAGDSPEETIKQQLAIAIDKRLEAIIRNRDEETFARDKEHKESKDRVTFRTGPQHIIDAFFYFLESGTLPWWIADGEILSESAQIINAITQQEEQFVALFLSRIKAKPVLLERMLLQYDTVWLTYCYSLIAPLELFSIVLDQEQHLSEAFIRKYPPDQSRKQYWAMAWHLYPVTELATINSEVFQKRLEEEMAVLVGDSATGAIMRRHPGAVTENNEHSQPEPMVQAIKDNDKGIGKEKDKEQKEQAENRKQKEDTKNIKGQTKEAEEPVAESGLLVANAGLILLHPFLQYFFGELGLLDEVQFRDQEAKDTAVHLLHYLATGKEQAPDFDLVFEKYLCGMKPVQITDRYTLLSDTMKAEAETLLASVIKHWQVLKSASAAGLQEGFLQRKGKLIINEGNHRLIMEQTTLDILLGQIPWNISLVKLPWKEGLLHVEWAR